jgi:hypothetical protein
MKKILLLWFIVVPSVFAVEQSHTEANLVEVFRGGSWRYGEHSGHLRVRKYEVGSTHHIHKVVIDWIHVPADGVSPRKVIKSKVILPFSDTWRVGYPSFKRKGAKLFIHFDAMQSYDPTKFMEYTIEVKDLGVVSVSSKALTKKK